MDSLHAYNFWGMSPSVDMECLSASVGVGSGGKAEGKEGGEERRYLVVGGGDPRHVLSTICGAHRREGRFGKGRVKIYVYEGEVAVLARSCCLLAMAFDPASPQRDRVEHFLEVFGNAFVEERAWGSLLRAARSMDKAVADTGKKPEAGSLDEVCQVLFDPGMLGYKSRDAFADVVGTYLGRGGEDVDMGKAREGRSRLYYGDRYDFRRNLMDWHYHNRVAPLGAGIVHWTHFRGWRESGNAFEFRDGMLERANGTLLAYAEGTMAGAVRPDGTAVKRTVARRGFWGDLVNSPYYSFGLDAEEESLFEKRNGKHTRSTTDVAEYNLTAWLSELESGQKYEVVKVAETTAEEEAAKLKAASQQNKKMAESRLEEVSEEEAEKIKAKQKARSEYTLDDVEMGMEAASLETGGIVSGGGDDDGGVSNGFGHGKGWEVLAGFTVVPFTGDLGRELKRAKWAGSLTGVFLGNKAVHLLAGGEAAKAQSKSQATGTLSESLRAALVPGGWLLTEGPKFALDLNKEQREMFAAKVGEYCVGSGFRKPPGGQPTIGGKEMTPHVGASADSSIACWVAAEPGWDGLTKARMLAEERVQAALQALESRKVPARENKYVAEDQARAEAEARRAAQEAEEAEKSVRQGPEPPEPISSVEHIQSMSGLEVNEHLVRRGMDTSGLVVERKSRLAVCVEAELSEGGVAVPGSALAERLAAQDEKLREERAAAALAREEARKLREQKRAEEEAHKAGTS